MCVRFALQVQGNQALTKKALKTKWKISWRRDISLYCSENWQRAKPCVTGHIRIPKILVAAFPRGKTCMCAQLLCCKSFSHPPFTPPPKEKQLPGFSDTCSPGRSQGNGRKGSGKQVTQTSPWSWVGLSFSWILHVQSHINLVIGGWGQRRDDHNVKYLHRTSEYSQYLTYIISITLIIGL